MTIDQASQNFPFSISGCCEEKSWLDLYDQPIIFFQRRKNNDNKNLQWNSRLISIYPGMLSLNVASLDFVANYVQFLNMVLATIHQIKTLIKRNMVQPH
jgi:hypothetical protein